MAKKRTKKNQIKQEAKWKTVERIVKLLEQTLALNAKVESNVMLPVLTSNIGAKRQCDVVVWSGESPRETITIVEVQDRKRKVDVNTFDGWCTKLVEVGAQHLICVSRIGFSERVKEKALQRGPTIRLVKLEELKEDQWPTGIIDNCIPYLQVLPKDTHIKLIPRRGGDKLPEPLDHTINDTIFQYQGQEMMFSIRDFINMHVLKQNLAEGTHQFFFTWPTENYLTGLYIANNYQTPVFVLVHGTIEVKRYQVPLSFSSYKQVDQMNTESPIAWLMEAIGSINGEETEIRITFLPDKEGLLRPATIAHSGSRPTIKLPFFLRPPHN